MNMPSKKLTLSKETLRSLDDDQLAGVVGGAASKGLVCADVDVDSVVCFSGVCNSGAVCDSAVCNSGAVCQSGVICG